MPARTQREPPAIAEEVAGSAFELAGAGLGFVLGGLGLFGIARLHMAAFGVIAVGFALLAHGSTLALRWGGGDDRRGIAALAIEVGGGFAAIVLGVVAASDVHPLALLPAAAIVLGVALVLAGALRPAGADRAPPRAGVGAMVAAGAIAVALGVIAIVTGPIVPSALVVVVCVASALLVAGHGLAMPLVRRFA